MKTRLNFIVFFVFLTTFNCKNTKIGSPTEDTKNTESPEIESIDYLKYVDPNIGTAHSRWFFYTPAAVPFGMAKLGPSTNGSYGNESGWEAVGYDDRHTSIEGFANLHEFQIGGFLFSGMTGQLKTIPGTLENPDSGYRSRFKRETEIATPGYYSVKLDDYNIKVELTATKRVGFQRYHFPETENAYMILDIGNQLGESGKVKDASVKYIKETNTIEGWVITYPEYVKKYQPSGEVRMYFAAKLDEQPISFGTFKGENQFANRNEISGIGSGVFLKFNSTQPKTVTIKSGFSFTSIENAKENLRREAENIDFDMAVSMAKDQWSKELNKIKVYDSSEKNKTKFYTGLYHTLLGRGVASDISGSFPENDGSIGQIPLDENGNPEFEFYNTDSVWGAFWNLTQLWTLVWPEYYNDFVQSHLTVYKNSGWLGDGLANSKFVSGVGTNYVGLIIASAYQAGIRDYDVDLAFKAAYENEVKHLNRNEGAGKTDLGQFINDGFITLVPGWETNATGSGFSVSHSMEYSYSSYAVAQFAKSLGKTKEYEELLKLSENWKNNYDESIDFVRPKDSSGSFVENFDPFEPWRGFQEGNAWQYTFYVPHDPDGLINKMGEQKFVSRLDSIFTESEKTKFGGEDIDAFAGVKYLYNHGNQPSLHISWLFNFTDKPYLTQKWVTKIRDVFYGTEGIHGYGYGQDEDQGQLGAWYVMASLGLFDVQGITQSEPAFEFSTPLFDKVEIENGYGQEIIINRKGAKTDPYIQSIYLDGEKYSQREIPLAKLKSGLQIDIETSADPNPDLFRN